MKARDNSELRLHFWRADVYRLLAASFDFPSTDGALEVLVGELAEASLGDDDFRGLMVRLVENLSAESREKREGDYHHLFTTRTACPPCEGSYQRTERGPVIGDVTAFYAAFHLKFAEKSGPPDSIKMELGFMGYLCLKRAYALQNGKKGDYRVTEAAERQFLQNHLGRWAVPFASRLAAEAGPGFYEILSKCLPMWIENECRLTGASPSPLSVPLSAAGEGEEEEMACAQF